MINNFREVIALAIFTTLALLPEPGHSDWRMRAREHFEWHQYDDGTTGRTENFQGLSNTINFWYEKPYEYSLGLAFGPVLGSASREASPISSRFGDKIRLWTIGVEGKYFPLEDLKMFVRGGLAWQQLETYGNHGRPTGWGAYAGLGWEFPIGRVSLAPEFAIRQVFLQNDIHGMVVTPSLGLHFYPRGKK